MAPKATTYSASIILLSSTIIALCGARAFHIFNVSAEFIQQPLV